MWRLVGWILLAAALVACLVCGLALGKAWLAGVGIALIPLLASAAAYLWLRGEPEPDREALSAAFEEPAADSRTGETPSDRERGRADRETG